MNIVLAVTACAAVAALLLEYGGFQLSESQLHYLHITDAVVVGIFVMDRLIRLALTTNRRLYMRENRVDFVLMALAAGVIAVSSRAQIKVISAGALYVLITQAYILLTLITHAVGANLRLAGSGIHPSWLLIGSFAFLSLAGTGLLMLPAATPADKPIEFPDALFTATSACCVTGLVVRPSGQTFTVFGQAVILTLIQLGGLGFMLFGTMLALLVGKNLSLRSSTALGQMVSTEMIGSLGRLVAFIMGVTFVLEAIGAVLLYPMFAAAEVQQYGVADQARVIWYSVFHSISAFCNAGFSLCEQNLMEGVRGAWGKPLRDFWQINGVMAPLIVLGGLGFPVLYDCAAYAKTAARNVANWLSAKRGIAARGAPRPRLPLHTKMVLSATAVLIVGGAAGLLLVEPPSDRARYGAIGRTPVYSDDTRSRRDWPRMPMDERVGHAVFQSITARTAGFNTIDMSELSSAGKLWMCGLMIIGGSPGGTAGGMKTITFAILLIAAYSVLRRRDEVEVFRRSLPAEMLRRAVTVAGLYLGLVAVIGLLLCIAMRTGFDPVDLLFEACSACGTVGLSAGVTGSLNLLGKCVIIGGMFVGRIGPLTILLAVTSKVRRVQYVYPRENVVIG